MMKAFAAAFLLTVSTIQPIFSCSNIAVVKNEFAVIARTLDFPQGTGGLFAAGYAGKDNVSDINLSQALQGKAYAWKSKYNYLGQAWQKGGHVIDGINEAGLYAGYLYLPDFTSYPQYDPSDARPLLGIMDIVNFILGTSESVPDAVQKIKDVQVVENAMPTLVETKQYILAPLHVVMRDKMGRSAVLEWVDGKTVVHPQAESVLTNAPTYNWQRRHAQQYDYVKAGVINAKFDGAFMHGTGFLGVPGDWSSPSRFARAAQVVKHLPLPKNRTTAMQYALSALETVQTPPGTSESPTLWRTLSDLTSLLYFFQPLYEFDAENNVVASQEFPSSWKKMDLKAVFSGEKLPEGVSEAICKASALGEVKALVNWMQPTAGPAKTP